MARVLFQEQATYKTPTHKMIPCVPEKSLVMSNEIESLIKNIPICKTNSEAPKTVDAFEKLLALQTSRSSMPTNYAWILLRLLSHGKVPLPSRYEENDTAIPFWSEYQSFIAEKHTPHNGVGYAPLVHQAHVNSAYSHEEMHRNIICTWSVIFSARNSPRAVFHSKASCVAFTR